VTDARDGVVTFTHHFDLPDGEAVSTSTLRFRTADDLRASLVATGFTVDEIYGGWSRQPVGRGDGEFLVVAHRPSAH
jgi:hypothetical protein